MFKKKKNIEQASKTVEDFIQLLQATEKWLFGQSN